MKKVEKVSIAEISFTLDSDAYLSMKQYLDSLHNYYDKDPDGREIIADIEARIAELILEEQVYTKVVSKALIDTIIAQLGTPDQIDDEAGEESEKPGGSGTAGTTGPAAGSSFDASIPRRLHRSNEGRILGGVCSGLATYFNVRTTWVRIAFLLPLVLAIFVHPFVQIVFHGPMHWYLGFGHFSWGWVWVFFFIYIALWVALPMARTPRQKLEARGEKITPASIRQNFQGSVNTPAGKKAASVMAELVTIVGRVLLFIVKLMTAIVGMSFLFAAVLVLICMLTAIINPESVTIFNVSLTVLLEGLSVLSPLWFAQLIMLCALIPLTVIGLALLSFTFGWRLGRLFFALTLGTWAIAMIFFGIVALSNARFLHDVLPDRLEQYGDRRWEHHKKWRWEYYYKRGGREIEIHKFRETFENSAPSGIDSVGVRMKSDGTSGDTISVPDEPGGTRIEVRRIE